MSIEKGCSRHSHSLTVVVLLFALTGPASIAGAQDRDTTRRELATFDRFLDHHPNVARDLNQRPWLVNNRDYMEDHPDLREFLRNHPEVREELRENPRAFMRGERKFDKHEWKDRHQDRDWDREGYRY